MTRRQRKPRRAASRQRSRNPRQHAWLRRAGWGIAALMLAALAGAGLWRLLDQPIEQVTVTGTLRHVAPAEITRIVRTRLVGAGLLSARLDGVSRALAALPWVEQVTVRRRWPHALAIDVVEQTPVARWNQTGLLNGSGQLFLHALPAGAAALPQLNGPEGMEQQMTARLLSMQQRLTGRGLHLASVTLDERGAWHFALADGIVVRLGRSHVEQRFDRFVLAAAPLVQRRAAAIGYVDMRYGNGFAVGWKHGSGRAITNGDDAHLDG